VQHYKFSNQGTHNFAVYYGDRQFIERELLPAKAILAATYPNPFTDNLTVLFTLPGRVDSDFARISVYDLTGRKVKSDENNWEVNLNLSTNNLRDYLGGLGMKQDADASKDIYDRVRAPRFIEYLDINFPKPEYFAPEFSKDIVPTSDQYIWEFTVETNSKDPEIKMDWSEVSVHDYGKELWLYDKDGEVIIDTQEVQHYKFSNQGTRNFAVYYGDRQFIERELLPAKAILAATYPNPFTDNLTVLFTLPGRVDSDFARISVYDLTGRKVKILWEDDYQPGFYKASWDGTNGAGTQVAVGTYLIRLEVNGQESIYKRIIKY
jgi:hypothetical protein